MAASLSPPDKRTGLDARVFVRFALTITLLCALLFLAAGTWRWPAAWVFVAVYIALAVVSRWLVARRHPDLLAERAQFTTADGVKSWDKALAPLIAIGGPLAIMVIAGLDFRFGWPPPVPLWIELLALLVMVLGFAFGTWAMLANRFFSGVVRIQADRGHQVVSAGPYRYVRHPGYVSGIIASLAIPLALGSVYALIPAALAVALTVTRTVLEDRTLQAELPGYAEYAQRVRYRLLPRVW
jgi:protein-S-isoprenylcysteine O-methyltransferase Ste14